MKKIYTTIRLFFICSFPLWGADAGILKNLRYTGSKCSNLKVYVQYLKEAPPKELLAHPKCNAAARLAGTKEKAFWTQVVEPAYRRHFGFPSSLFHDQKSTQPPEHTLQSLQDLGKGREVVLLLSIDGGGVRGLYAAKVLEELERQVGKSCQEIFNMVAGTSTGGLIAILLNATKKQSPRTPAYSTSQIVQLYKDLSKKIFISPSRARSLRGKGGIFTSIYSAKPLEDLLRSYLQDLVFTQTYKPVLVTSFDAEHNTVFNFSTIDAVKDPSRNFFLWEGARATSAAPTFFKPFVLNTQEKGKEKKVILIDGAVGQNNPTLAGYLALKKLYPDHAVVVVSIGLSSRERNHKVAHKGLFAGGLVKNTENILKNLIQNSQAAMTHNMENMIPLWGGYYVRLEPPLSAKIDLDSTTDKTLKELEEAAMRTVQQDPAFTQMVDVIKGLVDNSYSRDVLKVEGGPLRQETIFEIPE